MKLLGASFKVGGFEYSTYFGAVLLLNWFTYSYIEFGKERELRNLLPARVRES